MDHREAYTGDSDHTRDTPAGINRRLSVAPMMDCTDRHDRYFLRLLSRHTLLYTEMVTTGALLNGNRERFLSHHRIEHPVALQLGGSDPREIAKCARLVEQAGFDEVNFNVGCPSARVKSGRFGACLMREPGLVADCVRAMRHEVDIPVTVKTRIGVDDHSSYEFLGEFVSTVSAAGCRTWIIHARTAWLCGLSPKENREIPPLNYSVVYRLKADFPDLEIILNGGIQTLEDAGDHLKKLDGVMIGREAYRNPYILSRADGSIFSDDHPIPNRLDIAEAIIPYVETQLKDGVPLNRMTRHFLGLFHGQPGARLWRRHISENAHTRGANSDVLQQAMALVRGNRLECGCSTID